MTMLYHFRVLERSDVQVRLRLWITNPDVLAWGAKAVPKNPRNSLNTPYFASVSRRPNTRGTFRRPRQPPPNGTTIGVRGRTGMVTRIHRTTSLV
jgi:hypothetical protein